MSSTSDIGARFLCSSTAACIAEIFTFPIDTTRVRMQVSNEASIGKSRVGMVLTAKKVLESQGVRAFYSGIPPAMIRQFVQCGVNLSLYLPIRNFFGADKDHSVGKKALAGACSGALGQFCAIPADIVKVRMQADNRQTLKGGQRRYKNTMHAFRTIYQDSGIYGLWRGAAPSCGRSAAIHSSGLASYDAIKHFFVSNLGFSAEASRTHVLASAISGFIASGIGCPFDVIKTRIMNHSVVEHGHITPLQMAVKTVKHEGMSALFKGFVPTFARLGPWQVMWLTCYEHLCIMATGKSKF